MTHERSRRDGIQREIDAAFATVQLASSRRDLGFKAARNMARECVAFTVASINKQLAESPLSEAETRLLQSKLVALVKAASRIPGPDGASVNEPLKAQRVGS